MGGTERTRRKARPPGRSGLGRAMGAVVLVAVGLALLRGVEPMILGAYGPLLAMLLWLLYESVVRRRRLEGFHYAAAVVTVPAAGFLATQVAMDRFRPLGPLVRAWQWTTGDMGVGSGFAWHAGAAEFAIGGLLSVLLGLTAGLAVRRLEQSRGWDLAPFFRGAIVGSFLSVPLLAVLFDMGPPPVGESFHPDRLARLAVLAAGFLLGGLAGTVRG